MARTKKKSKQKTKKNIITNVYREGLITVMLFFFLIPVVTAQATNTLFNIDTGVKLVVFVISTIVAILIVKEIIWVLKNKK